MEAATHVAVIEAESHAKLRQSCTYYVDRNLCYCRKSGLSKSVSVGMANYFLQLGRMFAWEMVVSHK